MDRLDPHPGVLLEPCREARPRGMVVQDRTRLIGQLRPFQVLSAVCAKCQIELLLFKALRCVAFGGIAIQYGRVNR